MLHSCWGWIWWSMGQTRLFKNHWHWINWAYLEVAVDSLCLEYSRQIRALKCWGYPSTYMGMARLNIKHLKFGLPSQKFSSFGMWLARTLTRPSRMAPALCFHCGPRKRQTLGLNSVRGMLASLFPPVLSNMRISNQQNASNMVLQTGWDGWAVSFSLH